MNDNGYNQFRVSQLGEIEFDVGSEHDESVMRLFLESRTGDQIALEIPHGMWTDILKALSAGIRDFPGGGLRQ